MPLWNDVAGLSSAGAGSHAAAAYSFIAFASTYITSRVLHRTVRRTTKDETEVESVTTAGHCTALVIAVFLTVASVAGNLAADALS